MARVIKLSDKIPRVDVDHYLASSPDEFRVCVLSARDVTVVRSYLYPGIEWNTRFVRPLGGDNYEVSTQAEFSEYKVFLSELDYRLSGGLTMALEDAINAVAEALDGLGELPEAVRYFADKYVSSTVLQSLNVINTANSCCQQTMINNGGGVVGTFPQGEEDLPLFGSQPPLGVPVGDFPEGYQNEQEYLTDKCTMANLLVDNLIQTLRNLGALGTFNAVAVAALIVASMVGMIILPVAAIPIMCAAIGVLSVGVTILAVVADEIEEDRETWVCAVYENVDVESVLSVIADLVDAIIATLGTTSPVGFAIKQIVLLLVNSDTVNQVFKMTAHSEYPDADCSNCEGQCLEVQAFVSELGHWGTVTGESPNYVGTGTNLENTQFPDYYLRIKLNFENIGWNPCDGPVIVRMSNLDGYTPGGAGGGNNINVWTRDGTEGEALFYSGPDLRLCTTNCSSYEIRSATPFTVDITTGGEVCS